MSIPFFIAEMNNAISATRDKCIELAATALDASKDAYTAMAASFRAIPEDGYDGFEYGMVLPSCAVADALLSMPMTSWEKFYRGMATWKANAPRYPDPARAEEDARGVMLMALADRCKEAR